MGETQDADGVTVKKPTFSILKRIVMGETYTPVPTSIPTATPFSILKRIVMGETKVWVRLLLHLLALSVSSSGS